MSKECIMPVFLMLPWVLICLYNYEQAKKSIILNFLFCLKVVKISKSYLFHLSGLRIQNFCVKTFLKTYQFSCFDKRWWMNRDTYKTNMGKKTIFCVKIQLNWIYEDFGPNEWLSSTAAIWLSLSYYGQRWIV